MHMDTQAVYGSARAAKIAARRLGIPLCYVPHQCVWLQAARSRHQPPARSNFSDAVDWFRELARGGASGTPITVVKRKGSKGRKSSPALGEEEAGKVEVVERARAVLTELARLSVLNMV